MQTEFTAANLYNVACRAHHGAANDEGYSPAEVFQFQIEPVPAANRDVIAELTARVAGLEGLVALLTDRVAHLEAQEVVVLP